MKKLFCLLIITAFIGLYCRPITSNANEMFEKGVKEIPPYGEFNYFRGITATEFQDNPRGIYYNYFDASISEGQIECRVVVENTKENEFHFVFDYIYQNDALKTAKVYFDEVLIYEANFNGDSISEVKVCEKVTAEQKTKIKDDYFKIISYDLISAPEDYELDTDALEEIGMFLIQGHRYKYNEQYKDKDVYFVTSIDNLLSFEDIKDKLTATDLTEGDLTEKIEIYNNTYNPADKNITIGDYKFDAVVYDTSGNTVYQTCYVKVVDTQAPKITASSPYTVNYTVQQTHSFFISKFTATDNVGVAKVEITNDTYTQNYNKPGTYSVTATATDTSGNTSSAVLTIIVEDEVAPKVEGPYDIFTTTLTPLTKEQIRNYFTFNDEIDPNVTRYELIDNDKYFENTKVPGRYSFKILAYDMYGNQGFKNFYLNVKDTDYPYITIDSEYTIMVNQGVTISREDIINFLNESGLLVENVVDVESLCFDDENPSGTYDANIILENGQVIKNKLVIGSGADYNPPIIAEKQKPVALICTLTAVVLLVAVMYLRKNKRSHSKR